MNTENEWLPCPFCGSTDVGLSPTMDNDCNIVRNIVECGLCEAFCVPDIWNDRKVEVRHVVRYLHNGASNEVWPSTEASARQVFEEFARNSPEALPQLVKKTITTTETLLQHIERDL